MPVSQSWSGLLAESRRSGKRQAAPFSQRRPKEEPGKAAAGAAARPTVATATAWHRNTLGSFGECLYYRLC